MRVPPYATRRSLAKLSRIFHEQLIGSLAEAYLAKRGITSEAASYFQLGFVGSNCPPDYKEFSGRLSIPYIVGDWVVGLKFRALDDRGQRYSSNPGFFTKRFFCPQTFMGLDSRIYVCEGEIDTMTLVQLGIPAVGVPGANSWEPLMGRAFRNREVVVLVDGKGKSETGKSAGVNLAKQILTSVDEGTRIILEDSDVNQFFTEHGQEKLMREIGWTQGPQM